MFSGLRGRLPLRGYRGPRASVHLSRVLVEAGVTPAEHLHGAAPVAERAVLAVSIGGRRAATTPQVQ